MSGEGNRTMTNEELVNLIQQGIDVTENLKTLYRKNERFIQRMVNRYSQEQDRDDLMQEAYFGLHIASQKYQADQGAQFLTYAGFWIKQSILRYLQTHGSAVRLPEDLQARIRNYKKWVNAYNMQLGRNPTDRELCQHLKITLNALNKLKKVFYEYGNIQSLDIPLSDEDDTLLGDMVQGESNIENEVIDDMMSADGATKLWDLVQEYTTEQENAVLIDRFKGQLTYKEIGESIGKSYEGARKVEEKALRKLRRPNITKQIREAMDLNYDLAYRGGLSSFRHTWTSSTEQVAIKNWETENKLFSRKQVGYS